MLARIRSGKKRAGACLLWNYEAEGEALPAVGDIEIVLDHLNEPAESMIVICETFEVVEILAL